MLATPSSTYDPSARGPDPGRRRPRRRPRAVSVALAGLAAVVVGMTLGAPSASAQAFSCDAYGYLFQTEATDTSTAIVQVDLATGAQNPIGTVDAPAPAGLVAVAPTLAALLLS